MKSIDDSPSPTYLLAFFLQSIQQVLVLECQCYLIKRGPLTLPSRGRGGGRHPLKVASGSFVPPNVCARGENSFQSRSRNRPIEEAFAIAWCIIV